MAVWVHRGKNRVSAQEGQTGAAAPLASPASQSTLLHFSMLLCFLLRKAGVWQCLSRGGCNDHNQGKTFLYPIRKLAMALLLCILGTHGTHRGDRPTMGRASSAGHNHLEITFSRLFRVFQSPRREDLIHLQPRERGCANRGVQLSESPVTKQKIKMTNGRLV